MQVLQDMIPGWTTGKTRAERPHGDVRLQIATRLVEAILLALMSRKCMEQIRVGTLFLFVEVVTPILTSSM